MDVSIAPLSGAIPPAVVRADLPAPSGESASAPSGASANASRLSAIVDMISRVTGRQVKLVPPTAYLVSAPSGSHPLPEVELDAPAGLMQELAAEPGPLEVNIASVLRTGTTDRMLLAPNLGGILELRAAVDLEI